MSTLMLPIPITLLPNHEDTWTRIEPLQEAYHLPNYPGLPLGDGRWSPLYANREDFCGVLWTNDDDGVAIARSSAPGFEPVAYTEVALRLRTLRQEGVSATDAFNYICDAHYVRETRVGELSDLLSAIIEQDGDQ